MPHPDGTPVWFELATPDVRAAAAFGAEVFGWQVTPSSNPAHGGYLVAGPDAEHGVAGIMAPPDGAPAGWRLYLAAADIDAVATRAVDLGGTVWFGPADIPDVGRIAFLADPQGVGFGVMAGMGAERSTAFAATAPDREPATGHGVWIELASPDPDGAFAFYGALFGWTKAGAMPMGAMGEYALIGSGDGPAPGAIMSSVATNAPARWNWYVHVDDIDAAVARARAAGGTVRQGPDPIPGGAFSANVADPQGLGIGLVGPRRS